MNKPNNAPKFDKRPLIRPKELQAIIYDGDDKIPIPNIYTFKPKDGEKQIDMHDYDWYQAQLKKHGHIILKNTGIKEAKDFN